MEKYERLGEDENHVILIGLEKLVMDSLQQSVVSL